MKPKLNKEEWVDMQGMRVAMLITALVWVLHGCTTQGELIQGGKTSAWEHFTTSALNHNIFDAVFVSEDEGWAVGEHGTIVHYQNGKWERVEPTLTEGHLFSVAFPTPKEGWAVGVWGTILHYDGKVWKKEVTPEGFEAKNFEKVVFTAPDQGWAVGDSAGIAHYDGNRWQKVAAPIMALLREQKVKTEQYGLVAEAIGEAGFEAEAGYYHDVVFLSPKDGWIVGNLGQILHYDGDRWQEVKSPTRKHLYALCLLPSGEGWAVGQEGTMLHYDGKEWKKWPSSPTRRHLLSICVSSGKEVYAGGQGGVIIRYDGTDWKVVEGPQVKRMVHFYFVATQKDGDLWVFSTTRGIFRQKGATEPSKSDTGS